MRLVDLGQDEIVVVFVEAGARWSTGAGRDSVDVRLAVVLEHALELADCVLVLDETVLQLMAFVAEVGQCRVLLDEHLFDALVLVEHVRVHFAKVVQLVSET